MHFLNADINIKHVTRCSSDPEPQDHLIRSRAAAPQSHDLVHSTFQSVFGALHEAVDEDKLNLESFPFSQKI